jgi:hypothetical protein
VVAAPQHDIFSDVHHQPGIRGTHHNLGDEHTKQHLDDDD